jgi:hypothetical protein
MNMNLSGVTNPLNNYDDMKTLSYTEPMRTEIYPFTIGYYYTNQNGKQFAMDTHQRNSKRSGRSYWKGFGATVYSFVIRINKEQNPSPGSFRDILILSCFLLLNKLNLWWFFHFLLIHC